jgi:chromosome segregation ATPase
MRRSLRLCVAIAALQPIALRAQHACPAGATAFASGRATASASRSFGDLRVCGTSDMLNADEVSPAEWVGRAPLVVLETSGEGSARVMRVEPAGVTFSISGAARPIDSTVMEWRTAVIEILDVTWRVARLRAREGTLQAELTTLRGRPGGTQAIAASMPADAEALRAERQRFKGDLETIAAEVSRIRDDQQNLRRDIRYEQSSIADLQSQLRSAGTPAERNRINNEIRRHSAEIRRLQGAIERYEMDVRTRASQSLDLTRRIEKLDRQIRGVDMKGSEMSAERASTPDVEAQIAMLERQLADLGVDRNVREQDARVEAAVQRLRRLLSS